MNRTTSLVLSLILMTLLTAPAAFAGNHEAKNHTMVRPPLAHPGSILSVLGGR
jgi:hypothetical protein